MQERQLASIQRRFKADILNETSRCTGDLKSTPEHSPFRRLDAYRLAILQQVECVAEDFPILAEHLGDIDKLEEIIERFLRTRPSTFTTIGAISSGFADYLHDIQETLLSEIARYDWAQVLSKTESENTRSYFSIAQLTESDLTDAQLITDPTLQLFTSPYCVHLDNEKKPCFLSIRLVKGEIEIVELEKNLFRVLRAIVAKKPLPEISLELTGTQVTSEAVSQAFAEWVKTGTIIGFVNNQKD